MVVLFSLEVHRQMDLILLIGVHLHHQMGLILSFLKLELQVVHHQKDLQLVVLFSLEAHHQMDFFHEVHQMVMKLVFFWVGQMGQFLLPPHHHQMDLMELLVFLNFLFCYEKKKKKKKRSKRGKNLFEEIKYVQVFFLHFPLQSIYIDVSYEIWKFVLKKKTTLL